MTDPLETFVNAHRTYRVEHAGKVYDAVPYATMGSLLARITSEAAGVPHVVETTDDATPAPVAPTPTPVAPAPVAPTPAALVAAQNRPAVTPTPVAPAPATPTGVVAAYTAPDAARGANQIDERGLARSKTDFAALVAAGFSPEQTIFARGSRVIEDGVRNARRARVDFESKPRIGEAMDDLIDQIVRENRDDLEVDRNTVLMDGQGRLVVGNERLTIDRRAFASLVSRLGLPTGAGSYLAECWPDLRARNVNNWQKKAVADGREASPLKLRTRDTDDGRAIFGVVTEHYTPFDVDKVAEAARIALPPDARAEVTYDGQRARITALFHSTVNPADYVAGEFFRVGIQIGMDDTGGGSIGIKLLAEQNLCLNLVIVSRQAQPVVRVRHVGSVNALAEKIRQGLRESERAIAPFLKQWGYARQDDLAAAAKARGEIYEGMKASEILAALANGAIERELVPVRGRRSEVVGELTRAWEKDRSADGPSVGTVTRAGLVNAFTRWAHESAASDPFFADEVQTAASRLLWPADSRLAVPVVPALPLT
jgi:hypothetical protein